MRTCWTLRGAEGEREVVWSGVSSMMASLGGWEECDFCHTHAGVHRLPAGAAARALFARLPFVCPPVSSSATRVRIGGFSGGTMAHTAALVEALKRELR